MRDKIIRNANGVSLGHLLKGILVTALIYQCPELSALDLQEFARLAEFDDVSGIEDHLCKSVSTRQASDPNVTYDFISIHDGLQPVSDREQRHIRSQVGTERVLDHSVRLVIDGRCGCKVS